MTHEELRELIPGYALDALTAEEARSVEQHLPGCIECAQELGAYLETAAALAEGVESAEPPPELRRKVLAAAGPRGARIRSRQWMFGLAAAALIVILAGVIAFLSIRLSALTARLSSQEQMLALLANPSARTAILTGSAQANVRFVYDRASGRGMLVVSGLQDPGARFVYQLWLIAGRAATPAGVFRPVQGRPIIVPVTADLNRYQLVGISVEQAPEGAPQPTSAPILVGRI